MVSGALCIFLVFLLNYAGYCHISGSKLDPEIFQTATQIIKDKGYEANEYIVQTSDGYYLTLHRIRPKVPATGVKRNVVFLQHGLLDSSHTWINNLANQSLGFILADRGFDVWLGNSRGNTYSQNHGFLHPNETKFWEFSWDDMARYDLPSCINFIREATGIDKIFYVGHSQGCQIAFAQFNNDAALRANIAAFAALAPVAYFERVRSPIRFLSPLCQTVDRARHIMGSGRFLPSSALIRFLGIFLCGPQRWPLVCENIIFLLTGYNPSNTNQTRIPVYVAHTPAGTSVQNIVHYCQSLHHGRFQAFDYGWQENMKKYHQRTPPLYGLKNVDIPVSVYWGGNDWLATPQNVQTILRKLPQKPFQPISNYMPHYSHLDFVWGLDAATALYPNIIQFFQKYQH